MCKVTASSPKNAPEINNTTRLNLRGGRSNRNKANSRRTVCFIAQNRLNFQEADPACRPISLFQLLIGILPISAKPDVFLAPNSAFSRDRQDEQRCSPVRGDSILVAPLSPNRECGASRSRGIPIHRVNAGLQRWRKSAGHGGIVQRWSPAFRRSGIVPTDAPRERGTPTLAQVRWPRWHRAALESRL